MAVFLFLSDSKLNKELGIWSVSWDTHETILIDIIGMSWLSLTVNFCVWTANNAPVFFSKSFHFHVVPFILILKVATHIVRDPAKFPPLIQSQGRDPLNNLGNADTALWVKTFDFNECIYHFTWQGGALLPLRLIQATDDQRFEKSRVKSNYFPNNPETMNMFLRIFSSAGASRGQLPSNFLSFFSLSFRAHAYIFLGGLFV